MIIFANPLTPIFKGQQQTKVNFYNIVTQPTSNRDNDTKEITERQTRQKKKIKIISVKIHERKRLGKIFKKKGGEKKKTIL